MKDFTTLDYIQPIIDEITGLYYIDTAPAALKDHLNRGATLILTDATAAGPGRACYIIGPETAGEIPTTPGLFKLYLNIDKYAAAVETYPGELDTWTDREKDRARIAAGTALINKYNRQPIPY